ncbi:alpha-glucosidase [Alkalihalophilus lindianensis]|uniref:oligo-1,6-glucosidase n=1 Tax=Alkalihalophilus lindianensis TaxID=1630542 RepID=A0ABU3XAR3_9BACI|nr:alpha-glucosidase [Alkalihalophilus lindianensis]MDV2684981.1 alpha-glucosidase [Alkalihalophilus lindianensis]
MSKQWWKESVVYQIYPRSFADSNGDGIGDIQGIISKLDYLKWLGIDVIWLSPVYDSPNDDNGYDIRDYYAIMKEFGTMDDWEKMLDEIHQRDMKLIMDLVVNHSSDECEWFVKSASSKTSPYRDYYIWRPAKEGGEPNNWESHFSGSAWQYHEKTNEYFLHLFSKKQPDFNWENASLRQEMYKMMSWWLDKGIDGFRMDVINMISKAEGLPNAEISKESPYQPAGSQFLNGPNVHTYLQEMNEQVLSNYDIMTVGETPGVTPDDAALFTGGDRNELNMVFQFDHMDVDSGPGGKWDIKPWSLRELKRILDGWQLGLQGRGWNSLYLNNHDQPRMVSRFGDDKKYREKSAKMLATFLHTLQGTPYIYQGEEIGMTNVQFNSIEDYQDIETLNMYQEATEGRGLAHEEVMRQIFMKGRDNARTPMQWDTSSHGGFTTGTPWLQVNPNYKQINVDQAKENPDSILHYYRNLIKLRREHPIMVYGVYSPLDIENDSIYSYTREWQGKKILVILNFTKEEQPYEVPKEWVSESVKLFISNQSNSQDQLEDQKIHLTPYEARVYFM